MAIRIANILKANAEIESAEAVLMPALEKAKVSQVVNGEGKAIPLAQASISDKISALLAVNPPGAGQQQVADLLVTNASLASQIETLSDQLNVATATVGGLQADKQTLTTRCETAERSVQSLTGEKASKELELKAAISENSRQTAELNKFNAELSRMCVRAGCLTLTKDGKSLPPDATEEDKVELANAIPWNDKLSAYNGAVQSAVARIGIPTGSIPTGGTATLTVGDAAVLNRLDSISDPMKRAHFFKENEKAIFAARRAMSKK